MKMKIVGDVSTRAIIGVAITVVVALALLPVITDFTTSIANDCRNTTSGDTQPCGTDPANETAILTGTQVTLINLIPTFYIIGVVVGVVIAALVLARSD